MQRSNMWMHFHINGCECKIVLILFQSSFNRNARIKVAKHSRRIVEWAVNENDVVAPFVIDGHPPASSSRHALKLCLFTCHVPKIYISNIRMNIWKQLVVLNRSDITVRSHSVKWALNYENCSNSRGCRAYRTFDFDRYRSALSKPTMRMSPAEYKQQLYNHRFVLVASGDFPSTAKISESIVHFANGAAVPIFVVPSNPARVYPYSYTVQYCNIAILISERFASKRMMDVINYIESISQQRISDMRKYAQTVSKMFNYDTSPPNAADFVFDELCNSIRKREPISLKSCIMDTP